MSNNEEELKNQFERKNEEKILYGIDEDKLIISLPKEMIEKSEIKDISNTPIVKQFKKDKDIFEGNFEGNSFGFNRAINLKEKDNLKILEISKNKDSIRSLIILFPFLDVVSEDKKDDTEFFINSSKNIQDTLFLLNGRLKFDKINEDVEKIKDEIQNKIIKGNPSYNNYFEIESNGKFKIQLPGDRIELISEVRDNVIEFYATRIDSIDQLWIFLKSLFYLSSKFKENNL